MYKNNQKAGILIQKQPFLTKINNYMAAISNNKKTLT
jgi:hypothetical protein